MNVQLLLNTLITQLNAEYKRAAETAPILFLLFVFLMFSGDKEFLKETSKCYRM